VSETLDDKFFDHAFKILNYAVEFVNTPGYPSLRMTDTLEKTVELSSRIEGITRTDFYEHVMQKFKNRKIMSQPKSHEIFLDELMEMFIEEWRGKIQT